MPPLNIVHLHSTFAPGGKELRAVRLMNAWGDAARHTVVSAMQGVTGARDALDPAIVVAFPGDAPPLAGRVGPKRWRALADYMSSFDLVLTYNWGAMDAVFARRWYAGGMRLPPVVHHEDGFNEDEIKRRRVKRNLYRHLALPGAHALVVPSETLERIAHREWGRRAIRIANGVDVGRFAGDAPGRGGAGGLVVGTVAGLRPVKDLPMLVRAVARVPGLELDILGEGPERMSIACQAHRSGLGPRFRLLGHGDPAAALPGFDMYALSSLSEQAPISLIEAMAAGLPVVATDVGDVAAMVSEPNRRFIVKPGDEEGFGRALAALAGDAETRGAIGEANRLKALAEFDERVMIACYARLYGEAAGRPDALVTALS